jgi:molybdopterin-guanine dinucleotide biosynthesis protein A
MGRENLQGWVLAGGQSRRMGSDKALLFHRVGSTQIEHAAAILFVATGVTPTILGSAERYGRFGLPVIEDLFAEHGPLAGIHAALSSPLAADLNLITAVDLPNLTAGFLETLVEAARANPDRICVIAEDQPLCGVYRPDCQPAIESALKAGLRKVTTVVREGLNALEIPVPDRPLIENMNTLGDWQYHLKKHE